MTIKQIEEFELWHEARLIDLGYPPEIIRELTTARMKWISQVRVKK